MLSCRRRARAGALRRGPPLCHVRTAGPSGAAGDHPDSDCLRLGRRSGGAGPGPELRPARRQYHRGHQSGARAGSEAPGTLVEKPVRTEEEVQAILGQVRESKVDGIVQPASLSLNIPGFIVEATSERGIPTMFESASFVERGGLASYAPDDYASGWQAARLVDKILRGTTPAEIPVEVNPKLELVINLKVAKSLGLTIAPEMLYRADRLIR